MGVKIEDFPHLTPLKLEYIAKGFRKQQELKDEQDWRNGIYTLRALMTALDSAFNGKKATTQYPSKPFMQEEIDTRTEEEKIKAEIDKAILADLQWSKLAEIKGLPKLNIK